MCFIVAFPTNYLNILTTIIPATTLGFLVMRVCIIRLKGNVAFLTRPILTLPYLMNKFDVSILLELDALMLWVRVHPKNPPQYSNPRDRTTFMVWYPTL